MSVTRATCAVHVHGERLGSGQRRRGGFLASRVGGEGFPLRLDCCWYSQCRMTVITAIINNTGERKHTDNKRLRPGKSRTPPGLCFRSGQPLQWRTVGNGYTIASCVALLPQSASAFLSLCQIPRDLGLSPKSTSALPPSPHLSPAPFGGHKLSSSREYFADVSESSSCSLREAAILPTNARFYPTHGEKKQGRLRRRRRKEKKDREKRLTLRG